LRESEQTGEWRRLLNEEVYDLCSSPNTIQMIKLRRMRWVGHLPHMGGRRGAYRVLVGRPEEKRALERPWHIWEFNIEMDLQEVGWGGKGHELA
jgi:hypothetical protein